MATGYNVVDVAAAKERGIVVSNVPIYGTKSVAQHVFALILEHAQNVGAHAAAVNEGRWSKNIDWCFWDHSLSELDGKTLGIVGYGRIGQAVADLGRAFGMKVIVASRTAKQGVEQVSIDELFQRSDVVSLHCPQTPETEGLVNAQRIELMKPSALLVNTSRGPLVVEERISRLHSMLVGSVGQRLMCFRPNRRRRTILY